MKYKDYLKSLSPARLNKYAHACKQNKTNTIHLYQCNIKLSQCFYGIISLFEIALRNVIDTHYKQYSNDTDWIVNQACRGALLEQESAEISQLYKTCITKGTYSCDRMVSSLTFGFWTYLFTKRNYSAGGKTLLKIFPNKAHNLNQPEIYIQLTEIRRFRNRIAHHEPICFNSEHEIDTSYAKQHYDLIKTYQIHREAHPEGPNYAPQKNKAHATR